MQVGRVEVHSRLSSGPPRRCDIVQFIYIVFQHALYVKKKYGETIHRLMLTSCTSSHLRLLLCLENLGKSQFNQNWYDSDRNIMIYIFHHMVMSVKPSMDLPTKLGIDDWKSMLNLYQTCINCKEI